MWLSLQRSHAKFGRMFALPNPDYETHPRFSRFVDQVDDALRRDALDRFLPPFEAAYRRHLAAPRPNYDRQMGEGDELLSQLQAKGCALAAIAPLSKKTLVQLTWPVAAQVHSALEQHPRPRFKHTQFRFSREEHAEVFGTVEQIFAQAQVFAAVNAYAGAALALKEVAVQVNTDRMTALEYGPLDADGLPSPRTRYFHIDSALWPNVKVLIYLSDVTADQGPFRYVEGSHRQATDFELVVRKVNDREAIGGGLFMALPPPFRMFTSFGDYMDPESEQARALLANERVYCDGVSDLMLFDFNGVHRGGFVRSSYRYMLQCHFAPRDWGRRAQPSSV